MKKSKKKVPELNIEIRYVALEEVAGWPTNPKEHDLDAIKGSIERFGFTAPAILDATSERLVAGHGRLEVLLAKFAAGDPVPKRIKVLPDGRWAMPVIFGVSFDSEEEAEAYLLADNALTTAGGWNTDELTERVQYLSSQGTEVRGLGFSDDAIAAMLGVEGEETEAPEPKKEPRPLCKAGDVWNLGPHQLVVGAGLLGWCDDAIKDFTLKTGIKAERG